MSVGSVIKQSRLSKRLKQSTVASEVGVTVQTYIKWENDDTEPKASQIAKLSEILKVSSNAICSGKPSTKRNMTNFIRYFSKITEKATDFEVGLTIWEKVEDDEDFLERLRENAGIPFKPAMTLWDKENKEPIFVDENGDEIEDQLFKS